MLGSSGEKHAPLALALLLSAAGAERIAAGVAAYAGEKQADCVDVSIEVTGTASTVRATVGDAVDTSEPCSGSVDGVETVDDRCRPLPAGRGGEPISEVAGYMPDADADTDADTFVDADGVAAGNVVAVAGTVPANTLKPSAPEKEAAMPAAVAAVALTDTAAAAPAAAPGTGIGASTRAVGPEAATVATP